MLPRYGKPLNPPYKEKLPEIRSLARHPWELTLREFTEKVWRDYGIELSVEEVILTASLLLMRGRQVYPLALLGEDDPLSVHELHSLCKAFHLPPADFHLDPEDP
jgi:hypothetical protein